MVNISYHWSICGDDSDIHYPIITETTILVCVFVCMHGCTCRYMLFCVCVCVCKCKCLFEFVCTCVREEVDMCVYLSV